MAQSELLWRIAQSALRRASHFAHRAPRAFQYILPRMNPSSTPQPYLNRGQGAPAGAEPGRGVEPEDEALVRRMADGDDQALGVLYDRWHSVVHGVVSRMLRQAEDVEDVVEETFWQAWRQASRFDRTRGAVQTWLLTIARSRALDRVRALRRRREEPLEGDDGQVVVQQAAESDPGLDVEASERRRIVGAALTGLPAEQREALELGYYGGLSQTEIAERTGQPLGTVKTRMRLALQKLRSQLQLLAGEGVGGESG